MGTASIQSKNHCLKTINVRKLSVDGILFDMIETWQVVRSRTTPLKEYSVDSASVKKQ